MEEQYVGGKNEIILKIIEKLNVQILCSDHIYVVVSWTD